MLSEAAGPGGRRRGVCSDLRHMREAVEAIHLFAACVLATLIIVAVADMCGFRSESGVSIGSRARKPTRSGHSLTAALFGAGLLLAILALTALPLGGLETYRDFTGRLLQRFDWLRAQLGAIEARVEHLGERDHNVRAVLRIKPSLESSSPTPTVAGLVAATPIVSRPTPSSPPREARRRWSPPRGAAAPEKSEHEHMDKTPTKPASANATSKAAARSRREAGERSENAERADKVEKLDKIVRIERVEKPPKIERPEKLEKIERPERRGK